MAIDTKAKRLSIMCMAQPWTPTIPPPDGSINAADRAHFIRVYRGITLSGAVAAVRRAIARRLWWSRRF